MTEPINENIPLGQAPIDMILEELKRRLPLGIIFGAFITDADSQPAFICSWQGNRINIFSLQNSLNYQIIKAALEIDYPQEDEEKENEKE